MASSSYSRDVGLAFAGGFVAAILLSLLVAFAIMKSSDAYGLGHWKLNARMPLTSMWSNLGYWTDPKGGRVRIYEEACAGLLRELLNDAGLLTPSSGDDELRSLAVLDLGFGCGDQTWELVHLTRPGAWHDFRYVGLTLDQTQTQAAWRLIHRETSDPSVLPPADSFKLFCADAARPDTWDPATEQAVKSLADRRFTDRWLLALDCIYYFKPSRKPVLEYAARQLGANFVAFDLLLNPQASYANTLAMRAVGFMMGCPIGTFLTEEQYREQLVECGYDSNTISIRDITEHVFSGIVDFMEHQERALSYYGISLGGHKLAGRLFDWFGRSKVVKAVIVVSRTQA
jgi:hypothetical protein